MLELPATATARRARRDGGGLELLEVLEHADHRVAPGRVRLVGDRAAEVDSKLGAQLRLDQAIRAQRLFGVVVVEVSLAASRRDPDRGKGGRTATGLRRGELLHRGAEAL